MEYFLEQLLEINKMYIVNVTSGVFLPTGSFLAKDAEGKEYFANQAIIKICPHIFNALSTGGISYWILVNDEVWEGKWKGKEVSKINTIYQTEIECQYYKTNKMCKLLLINERYKSDELINETFEVLKVQYNKLRDLFSKIKDKGGKMEREDYEVEISILLEIENYKNKLELYKKIDLVLGQKIKDLNNGTQFII
jgi:hypothetical protein